LWTSVLMGALWIIGRPAGKGASVEHPGDRTIGRGRKFGPRLSAMCFHAADWAARPTSHVQRTSNVECWTLLAAGRYAETMIPDQPTDAESFYGFLGDQLAQGGRELSPEELLRAWRSRTDPEYAATVEALRQALADMAHGDVGKPLDQFAEEIRQRYNLPADA
jgi:hypothetical protein